MSMGQAKVIREWKDAFGNRKVERAPIVPLNLAIKQAIIQMVKRPDSLVDFRIGSGDNESIVKCANGTVIKYTNAWDYGWYCLSVNGEIVGEIDCYEGDNYTSKQQQDIFDVANVIREQRSKQEDLEAARKQLSEKEQKILSALTINKTK